MSRGRGKCVCKTSSKVIFSFLFMLHVSPKKLKYDFFSRYQREVSINRCFQRTGGGGGGEATGISHYMSPQPVFPMVRTGISETHCYY